MDDVLDELLHDADEDLHGLLERVIDVEGGLTTIVGAPSGDMDVCRQGYIFVVPYSVEHLIAYSSQLIRRLPEYRAIAATLRKLESGLSARKLSQGEAEELIAEIERKVQSHDRFVAAGCADARKVLTVLERLRLAVGRLFDDVNDQSVRCPNG
jgi:hypothetical protein